MKAIIFLLLFAGMPVFSYASEDLEAKIRQELKTRHPENGAAWWKALGPLASVVILKLYKESDHTYEKLRLLEALSWFDDEAGTELLKATADRSQNGTFRNTALRSLARSQGVKEAEYIAGYMEHADPRTRLAAAKALKSILENDKLAAQAIAPKLEHFRKSERTPWVLIDLDKPERTPRVRLNTR